MPSHNVTSRSWGVVIWCKLFTASPSVNPRKTGTIDPHNKGSLEANMALNENGAKMAKLTLQLRHILDLLTRDKL